jgi:aminopeptidase N
MYPASYMRVSITAIWILLAGFCVADTYVRQASVDVIHYDISVELTDASDSITGVTKIKVLMRSDNVPGIWLNFEGMLVDKLFVGGIERTFTCRDGRLEFQFDRIYARNEIVPVEVRYHGAPKGGLLIRKNRHGRRVVFADNWPDNAHQWFPCIDHPSDKAAVTFTITAPAEYDVVAIGRIEKSVSLQDGRRITQWTESRTIPTYCMAFGIAEFSITHSGKAAGVPITWYAYPEDSETAALKFRWTSHILSYFENLIGPYPYEKLAQVESSIQVGGMENASAIFYSESYFMRTPVSEEPVAHEIAHQWFGNSVTEADWDHLWLSEGFATYFEALFYEQMKGHEALRETMARYAAKISGYKPAHSVPIVDSGQTDPRKKLNPLNYEKGAWVLHMLRGILGDKTFFEGIRQYYSLYAGKNTSSEDFQEVMESASGSDLSVFFRQWLFQPGWPEYLVRWHWNESAGELELSVKQEQATGRFDMPMNVVVSAEKLQEVHRIRISSTNNRFRIPLRTKPSAVEIDPDGWVLKTVSHAPY